MQRAEAVVVFGEPREFGVEAVIRAGVAEGVDREKRSTRRCAWRAETAGSSEQLKQRI